MLVKITKCRSVCVKCEPTNPDIPLTKNDFRLGVICQSYGIQVIRWLRNTSADAFSFGSACNLGSICSQIRIIRTLTATTTHTQLTRPCRKPLNFFYTTFATTLKIYFPRDIQEMRMTLMLEHLNLALTFGLWTLSTFPLVNGISNLSKPIRKTKPIGSYSPR
jgi:hypothetical protein